jgi:hypothetical protein
MTDSSVALRHMSTSRARAVGATQSRRTGWHDWWETWTDTCFLLSLSHAQATAAGSSFTAVARIRPTAVRELLRSSSSPKAAIHF